MLFDLNFDPKRNLLPKDGEVFYFGKVLSEIQSAEYFQALWQNIEWKNDEAIIFGKKLITDRKVAWYADQPFSYTYSKVTKSALQWTPELLELKKMAEAITQEQFNSCLLNLYNSGAEGMAWHSDAEKDLKKNGAIGSMSFGAERKFCFKHKTTGQKIDILLEDGSLMVMKGETQTHWLHRLPPTTRILQPRINLTFRMIVQKA